MGSNLGSPVAAFFRETRFFALAVVIFVILLVHLDENRKKKQIRSDFLKIIYGPLFTAQSGLVPETGFLLKIWNRNGRIL